MKNRTDSRLRSLHLFDRVLLRVLICAAIPVFVQCSAQPSNTAAHSGRRPESTVELLSKVDAIALISDGIAKSKASALMAAQDIGTARVANAQHEWIMSKEQRLSSMARSRSMVDRNTSAGSAQKRDSLHVTVNPVDTAKTRSITTSARTSSYNAKVSFVVISRDVLEREDGRFHAKVLLAVRPTILYDRLLDHLASTNTTLYEMARTKEFQDTIQAAETEFERLLEQTR